jgi:uncharacterized protein (TIGR02246 family)
VPAVAYLFLVRPMKYWLSMLVLSAGGFASAQTSSDEEAVRALPRAFCAAWAKHDGHELAGIMAENVDFVTVRGVWLQGRGNFEKYHSRILSGRFRDSTNTPLEIRVRFLRPDEAVVHWSWVIEGEKGADGSPQPKRFGIMTMLARQTDKGWRVIVAQNTNGGPSVTEADDLDLPIRLPKAALQ